MTTDTSALASAVSKARWKLLPPLIVMYLMSILDRVNIGFAKPALQADTGISDAAFALGAGIFFVGYAIFEVPSNIVLMRVGARIWLTRIMLTWGLVAFSTMFVSGEMGFYVVRFLLGIAEAGFYPGVLLALTRWFPAASRGRANGILVFGFALSLVVGGPLSGALLEMNGIAGLHGWQWMFAVEGLLACVVAVLGYALLDDQPGSAAWLSVDEKRVLITVLDREAAAAAQHSPSTVLRTLRDARVLYLSVIFFTIQVAAYGLIFYLPTQIAGVLGQKVGLLVGFVTSIPWVVAAAATYFVTRWSDRHTTMRRLTVASLYIIFGIAIVASIHTSPVLAIAALSIGASAYLSGNPLFFTLVSEELSGWAMAAGLALINSVGNLGGFAAPTLKTYVEHASGTPSAGLDVLGAIAMAAGVLLLLMPQRSLGAHARGLVGAPEVAATANS